MLEHERRGRHLHHWDNAQHSPGTDLHVGCLRCALHELVQCIGQEVHCACTHLAALVTTNFDSSGVEHADFQT